MQWLCPAHPKVDPFVASREPSGTVHNYFNDDQMHCYEDQMLMLPDGRVALGDFEEAGSGAPVLDVGNFLAQLLWAARFGRSRDAQANEANYDAFRSVALDRFDWSERGLVLREAVCLLRVCTNAIRHPRAEWRDELEAGLAPVNETSS